MEVVELHTSIAVVAETAAIFRSPVRNHTKILKQT